jgi:hypothetical protein
MLGCAGTLELTDDDGDDESSGSATFSGVYFPSSFSDFASNLEPFIPSADCLLESGIKYEDNPLLFSVVFILSAANALGLLVSLKRRSKELRRKRDIKEAVVSAWQNFSGTSQAQLKAQLGEATVEVGHTDATGPPGKLTARLAAARAAAAEGGGAGRPQTTSFGGSDTASPADVQVGASPLLSGTSPGWLRRQMSPKTSAYLGDEVAPDSLLTYVGGPSSSSGARAAPGSAREGGKRLFAFGSQKEKAKRKSAVGSEWYAANMAARGEAAGRRQGSGWEAAQQGAEAQRQQARQRQQSAAARARLSRGDQTTALRTEKFDSSEETGAPSPPPSPPGDEKCDLPVADLPVAEKGDLALLDEEACGDGEGNDRLSIGAWKKAHGKAERGWLARAGAGKSQPRDKPKPRQSEALA